MAPVITQSAHKDKGKVRNILKSGFCVESSCYFQALTLGHIDVQEEGGLLSGDSSHEEGR
jgi:hypothetical protein